MSKAQSPGGTRKGVSENTPAAIREYVDEMYSWDIGELWLPDRFFERIVEEDWYSLIKESLTAGNDKIHKNTWIWSISPATDCPHLNSERCQVPKDACYAYRAEKQYRHTEKSHGGPLHTKRRQTILWDLLDSETFAETLIAIEQNKTSKVTIEYFRLNEAGDFRDRGDVVKFDRIAKILKDRIGVVSYCYSASSHIDWQSLPERNFTLNASNEWIEPHADKKFAARPADDIDDDQIVCPAEQYGRENIKCGECTLCMTPEAPDVYVPLH